MEFVNVETKRNGSWKTESKYVSYVAQIISFPLTEVFNEFKQQVISALDLTVHMKMSIEVVTGGNISKYLPLANDEDCKFFYNLLKIDSVKCSVVIEVIDVPIDYDSEDPAFDSPVEDEMVEVLNGVSDVNWKSRCSIIDDSDIQSVPDSLGDEEISPSVDDTCTKQQIDGEMGGEADHDVVGEQINIDAIHDIHEDKDDDHLSSPRPRSPYCHGVYISDGVRYIDRLDIRDYRSTFDVLVNDVYASKKLLMDALKVLAIKNHFYFKVIRSNQKRVYVACHKDGCEWHAHCSRFGDSQAFKVHTLNNVHICPVDYVPFDHPQASAEIIAEFIKEFHPPIKGKLLRPCEVKEFMRAEHGINVSYRKARKARELALTHFRGSPEASFLILTKFLYVVKERNPGTVIFVVHREEFRFKYMFIALKASIDGFRFCRPVISVDGTFLRGKYGGTMLAAVCMDANNHIFPICMAVVDAENDAAWEWFFTKLKVVIGNELPDLAIISDRHHSIKKAVSKVMPEAKYGYCMYHMSNNLKSRFKKKGIGEVFMRAARAYTLREFEFHCNQLYNICPSSQKYLDDAGPSLWARALFLGSRFSVMTTNISESFNSVMSPFRDYPLVAFIEEYIMKLQSWFLDRRTSTNRNQNIFADVPHAVLQKRIQAGRCMKVNASDSSKLMVSDTHADYDIDVQCRTCSCGKWQQQMLPCAHACAALTFLRIPIGSCVHDFYLTTAVVRTYAGSINPVGRFRQWDVPNHLVFLHLLPPPFKRQAGRPRMARIPSVGEHKPLLRCGRCNANGHKRDDCHTNLIEGSSCGVKRAKR